VLIDKEIEALTRRRNELTLAVSDCHSACGAMGVRPTQVALREMREGKQKQLRRLETLGSKIVALRATLDSERSSSVLTRLRETISEREVEIAALDKERESYLKWREYFELATHRLQAIRDSGVSDYIQYYGPLASIVQTRLRPVYGFGPIQLQQRSAGVALVTSRSDQTNLAPNAFFSESQLQILMLSLFLAAAVSQTWSSFAPILIDDPVTHFDDLNTYSLLDLIKGMAGAGVGHQFLISTCEERFYKLMRRKFSGLDAKFYEFKSIGVDGPVVERY
jgi:DNA repair protein SbcC/Rad50